MKETMLKRSRITAASLLLIGALLGVAGCAQNQTELLPADSQESREPPSDTELAIACGLDIVRELDTDGYFESRAAAISANLDWYAKFDSSSIQESTNLPYSLYSDLLALALGQLASAERELGPEDNLQMSVMKDGVEVGVIEVSPNADGRFGVTALGFAPADPSLCAEYYVGDHGP